VRKVGCAAGASLLSPGAKWNSHVSAARCSLSASAVVSDSGFRPGSKRGPVSKLLLVHFAAMSCHGEIPF